MRITMKKIIFLFLIITALITVINCPNNITPPDNNSTSNSNSIAVNNNSDVLNSNSKSEEAATAVENLPSFEIKLPAALAAGGTSAHARGVLDLAAESGLKSPQYGNFLKMLDINHTKWVEQTFNQIKTMASTEGSLPLEVNLSIWPGDTVT